MKPRIIFTALLMVGVSLFVAACGGNIQPAVQAENAVGALGNFLVPQSTRELFRESSPYEDVVFDKYEGAENALKEVADFCAD